MGRYIIFFFLISCSKSQNASKGQSASVANFDTAGMPQGVYNPEFLDKISGKNVVGLSVNGQECLSNTYVNQPCVSVTICDSDQQICEKISGILLDTGSAGLRVFKSALSTSLQSNLLSSIVHDGLGEISECVVYGDTSAQWGPLVVGKVGLGELLTRDLKIHLLDANYKTRPSSCPSENLDVSPAQAGFNGILGVAPWIYDCGLGCSIIPSLRNQYYRCSSYNCAGVSMDLFSQLVNPIVALEESIYQNGYVMRLPSVKLGGASQAEGYLILGAGTQENNTYQSNVYTLNGYGMGSASMNEQYYELLLDSGTNTLSLNHLPSSAFPLCEQAGLTGFYCPFSTQVVNFQVQLLNQKSYLTGISVGNATQLAENRFLVYSELASQARDANLMILGLPFFLGRNVSYILDGYNSRYGIGPLFLF